MLTDESLDFFLRIMKLGQFRRSIESETFKHDKYIRMVYSGSVICLSSNFLNYMDQSYLYKMNLGAEFG